VKSIWLVAVLSLLSIVAYSGFSDPLSRAAQPPPEMPATPSIAATPPSHNAPIGLIAFDASSGDPVPGSTGNDDNLAAGWAEYVFLHKTSNESLFASTTGLDVPWRWLRIYAVTERPIENR
jgi:hypothetical protein